MGRVLLSINGTKAPFVSKIPLLSGMLSKEGSPIVLRKRRCNPWYFSPHNHHRGNHGGSDYIPRFFSFLRGIFKE